MEFYIGQIFENDYPLQAKKWCDKNGAYIDEIEPENNVRRFEIKKIVIPEPAPAEVIKTYEDAVQKHLDTTAQSRGYDNTYTCLSYLSSTDEKWNREANAFNVWRDQVWLKCHEVLNSFMAGEIKQPTIDELIAQLPEINWNDPEVK